MHYFTVGVCLPAAIVRAKKLNLILHKDIDTFNARYNLFYKLYEWSLGVMPFFESEIKADQYIHQMATPGGITEAIIKKLNYINNFLLAMEAGVEKSILLSAITDE